MDFTSPLRISLRVLAGALLVVSSHGAAESLVPARFDPQTDSRGMRWDFTSGGAIGDGSNDCFDSGPFLQVNSNTVNFPRPMMLADGSEFVLTGRSGSIAVTRRIRLDAANAVLRYLELFQNTSSTPQSFQATIQTSLGSNAAMVVTEANKPFAGVFGKNEGTFTALPQGGDRPGVVFVTVDPKAKQKPTVTVEGNRNFRVIHSLTIQPGATVGITHYVAQRPNATNEDARALLKALYKSGRLIDPKIPKAFAQFITNFAVGPAPTDDAAPQLAALQTLLGASEITREKADTVVIDEGAKLSGMVTGGDFTIETEFGKTSVAFADVAGIAGSAGVQRPARIFLRSGEVLNGLVKGAKLAMATDTGLKFDVDLAQIQLLALRQIENEAGAAAGLSALLTTHRGDCFALSAEGAPEIQAATPWGMIRVPLSEVQSLAYLREPFPSHQLILSDRSRMLVMLRGDEWLLATTRFGKVKIVPQSVREMRRLGAASPVTSTGEDAEAIPGPSCTLIGENRLAGLIDLPELHLASATSTTRLDPAQIVQMDREASEDTAAGAVKVKLADGQQLTGRLVETVLPIRSNGRVWRVPAAHFLSIHVPPPEKPKPEAAPANETPKEAAEE